MQFRLDENLPIEAAEPLRRAGHTAVTVQDQQIVGQPDPHVAIACRSADQVLVTLDGGFADICTYPPAEYPGIVVLQPSSYAKPAVVALVTQLVALCERHPLRGKLWILQQDGLRILDGDGGAADR